MRPAIPAILAITLAPFLTSSGGPNETVVIPTVKQTQTLAPPADLRDFRYGEVITVFRDWFMLRVTIYNSIGLNDCPPEPWHQLNGATMAKQFGAERVLLNGPRHWVLNQIVAAGQTASGRIVQFGDLQMRQVGQIETKIWQGSVGDKFYHENQVQRATTWVYRKGNMVYELKSPKGDVYRMQSYAQIINRDLTIADLETLGARLKLPEGWSYQARVLTEDSNLKADGLAYVINDDLFNSYQKITR